MLLPVMARLLLVPVLIAVRAQSPRAQPVRQALHPALPVRVCIFHIPTAGSSTASAAAPAAASGQAYTHSTPADTAASVASDSARTMAAESGTASVSASSAEGANTSSGSAAANAAASIPASAHTTPAGSEFSAVSSASPSVAASAASASASAAAGAPATDAASASAAASAPATDDASASAAASAAASAGADAGVSGMAGLPLWQQQVLQAVRRINLSLGGKEHYSSFTSSLVRSGCKEQPVVMSHVSWLPVAPLHCDFSGQASVSSERSRSWLFNMLRVNKEPAAPAQALLMSIMTATAVHDYRPLHGSVDIQVLRSVWMQQSFMAGRLTMAARMRLALPQLYRFACSEQLQLLRRAIAQALALLNEARNHISCGPYEHMSAQAAVSAARRAGIESHNRSVAQGTARTMMTMGISQVQSELARAALAHSIRQSVEFERATAIDGRLSAALSVRPDREAAAGVLRNQHFLPWIDQHVLRSTLSSMARTYSSTSWDTLVERQEHAAPPGPRPAASAFDPAVSSSDCRPRSACRPHASAVPPQPAPASKSSLLRPPSAWTNAPPPRQPRRQPVSVLRLRLPPLQPQPHQPQQQMLKAPAPPTLLTALTRKDRRPRRLQTQNQAHTQNQTLRHQPLPLAQLHLPLAHHQPRQLPAPAPLSHSLTPTAPLTRPGISWPLLSQPPRLLLMPAVRPGSGPAAPGSGLIFVSGYDFIGAA